MMRLMWIETPEEREKVVPAPGLPAFEAGDIARHRADAHGILVASSSRAAAWCSLWWRNTPAHRAHRLGLIGHWAARDAPAARQLLDGACRELAGRGCTLAVGPVDGSTWRRYRLITERGTEPPFFLEPDNPDPWPGYFTGAGFTLLAQYSSAVCEDLSSGEPRSEKIGARLETIGVRLRTLKPERLEDDLGRIYTLSLDSFAGNLLFAPLSREEFAALYRPLLPCLQPDLILLAEHGENLVGCLFALPDLLEARRGGAIRTVIVKTVAVLPGRAYAGLGALLVARAHAAAREHGFTRAIHALMHDGNPSRNLSRRTATRTIRRYALFARDLRP